MKWKHLAAALAIAIIACMASTGVVRAEMIDNTNVAYMKDVSSSAASATMTPHPAPTTKP